MNRILCAFLTLLLTATTGSAHHAFAAEYDDKKLVVITGAVLGLEWVNPHAWLHVEGKDTRGKLSRWNFEMGAPGGLVRRGWSKTELKKGDHVTVDGWAARDGRNVANARMVTLPDGRKLFGGFQSTPGNPFK